MDWKSDAELWMIVDVMMGSVSPLVWVMLRLLVLQ
jgi:hypothetical protein